jgi:Protein of unknown function (DUF998)
MPTRLAPVTPHTSAERVTKREDSFTTALLAGGVVGGVAFPVLMLAVGAVREDYSALHQPGSMLSLGAGGWVQIVNFVVTGLLMIAYANGLRRALRSGQGATWAPLLIAIYGVGLVGAGVFPPDPSYGYPPGAPLGPATSFSVHGILHEIAGGMVFGPLIAACFVVAGRFATQGRRGWAAYSYLTGLAIPGFIAGAFNAWSSGSAANFGGAFQRMAIIAGWVWIALLALRIMRDRTLDASTSTE